MFEINLTIGRDLRSFDGYYMLYESSKCKDFLTDLLKFAILPGKQFAH